MAVPGLAPAAGGGWTLLADLVRLMGCGAMGCRVMDDRHVGSGFVGVGLNRFAVELRRRKARAVARAGVRRRQRRRCRRTGVPAVFGKRIVLADQPGQFGKRIGRGRSRPTAKRIVGSITSAVVVRHYIPVPVGRGGPPLAVSGIGLSLRSNDSELPHLVWRFYP